MATEVLVVSGERGLFGVDEQTVLPTQILPPAVYRIIRYGDPASPSTGLLRECDFFTLPSKIYGDTQKDMDLILSAYDLMPSACGIFLAGIQGSGKTTLVEALGNAFIARELPVILIREQAVDVGTLRMVISKIGDCLVMIEEMEKIYSDDGKGVDQKTLLTLFSDKSLPKVLFSATVNDKTKVNKYCFDRPGRFLFLFEYTGLKSDVVKQVCLDRGINPNFGDGLGLYAEAKVVTFDVIDALVLASRINNDDEDEFWEIVKRMNVPKPTYLKLKINKLQWDMGMMSTDVYLKPEQYSISCRNGVMLTIIVEGQDPIELKLWDFVSRDGDAEDLFDGKSLEYNVGRLKIRLKGFYSDTRPPISYTLEHWKSLSYVKPKKDEEEPNESVLPVSPAPLETADFVNRLSVVMAGEQSYGLDPAVQEHFGLKHRHASVTTQGTLMVSEGDGTFIGLDRNPSLSPNEPSSDHNGDRMVVTKL